jgi:hypothetical protein
VPAQFTRRCRGTSTRSRIIPARPFYVGLLNSAQAHDATSEAVMDMDAEANVAQSNDVAMLGAQLLRPGQS